MIKIIPVINSIQNIRQAMKITNQSNKIELHDLEEEQKV